MRVIVLLSGGLDSTVLLAHLLHEGHEVSAISFDYGQRHRDELLASYNVINHYNRRVYGDIKHFVVEIPLARHLVSSLTGHSEVPSGPYGPDNMSSTVVPNRNAIFLSVAAGVAASNDITHVSTAVHAGDHAVYRDCRPEFIAAIRAMTVLSCGVEINAPFALWSKKAIVARGRDLDVPFDITWSCYRGGPVPCNECATCIERNEALAS